MKTVSMVEFRRNAEEILATVQRGERVVLTYRGKPVARLEPFGDTAIAESDPFYALDALADDDAPSLTNEEVDEAIYGP